ncbi:MAG: radical SAM protein [Desulfobacterales bacterium]
MLTVKTIRAKSILNKSKLFDYCVNPYTGCQINCRYCYARLFMKRYSGHQEPWGEFVDVKINAGEVLKKQLAKAKKGVVWISSVCDPYQPLEKTYALTRRCLEVLAAKHFPVNIQTKSTLILRDLDILQEFGDLEAGFTITTDDEAVAKQFEPGAPPIKQRIAALKKLRAAGIATFAMVAPLLPGNPSNLIGYLEDAADRVLIDRMNYASSVKWFYRKLGFHREMEDSYFDETRERLVEEMNRRGMHYRVLF